jgi:hypothetical protein
MKRGHVIYLVAGMLAAPVLAIAASMSIRMTPDTVRDTPFTVIAAPAHPGGYLPVKISAALLRCQQIKPGMTRADLLKGFTTEGGLSTARHRTYVFRSCPYIKLDVDFTSSVPGQDSPDEQSGEVITHVSKPYLDWSVGD